MAHAPTVLAHPASPADEHGAVLHRDAAETAGGLAAVDPRDGATWLRLVAQWQKIKDPLLASLFTTFPPVRGPLRLLARIGTGEALRLARFLALPVHRMAAELFHAEPGRLLLTGLAMHADVPPDAPGSGLLGWLLAMLAQDGGFPVPVGGAGQLSTALAARAGAGGARICVGDAVEHILVRGGRVTGVRTAGGREVRVRRAVVADVSAPCLYGRLLPADAVPARLHEDLAGFEWDPPVVKLNWALDGRIPWRAAGARKAGTVHLGVDTNGTVRWMAELGAGAIPERPFILLGQMSTADPSRSPVGTESVWAYTHLPRGMHDDDAAELLAGRLEDTVEAHAPGFRDLVVGVSCSARATCTARMPTSGRAL